MLKKYKVVSKPFFVSYFMVISIYLGEQNIIHMVGKDKLLHYYIWSIGYYLNLQTNGSLEVLFPTFIDHFLYVDDDSVSKIV